jgi:hypothetical protein
MYGLPSFRSYGQYTSGNYGANAMMFTDTAGNDFYFSYRTLVAVRVPGKGLIVHENDWGPTTGKHLNWIDGGDKTSRVSGAVFSATVASWLGGE